VRRRSEADCSRKRRRRDEKKEEMKRREQCYNEIWRGHPPLCAMRDVGLCIPQPSPADRASPPSILVILVLDGVPGTHHIGPYKILPIFFTAIKEVVGKIYCAIL